MPKPRTNADAAQYWADSILSDTPAPAIDVNSIIVRADTVYSFGYHYPMGQIFRRDDGSVRRVVVTSSFYPSRGFASTPSDQWNVLAAAREACAQAGIRLEHKPLSHHGVERIPALPRPDDPEPEPYSRTVVPPLFTPRGDPGPEPVKDATGCVAHTREEYEYQEDHYVLLSDDMLPQDFTLWHRHTYANGKESKSLYVRRSHVGTIVWGDKRTSYDYFGWNDPQRATVDYKQCPHCAAFDEIHERWHVRMHGPRWGRGRGRGWALYSEMVERHGSEEGWREARRQDVRRVRAARKVRAEWEKRNLLPYDFVGRDADRIPILNGDGYARRIDGEAWRKKLRADERERRRLEREQRQREAMQRQLARIRAKREQAKARKFEHRAAFVAANLARIADELSTRTTEQES